MSEHWGELMGEDQGDSPSGAAFDRTRLVDQVTQSLRKLIISRQIPPGSQLLQVELAKMLGVSRTPLREAFRILERDGLVRISNGNRTVEVVQWTLDELRDLYTVREVLDGLSARLVARRGMTPELDAGLSRALDQMQQAAERRDHSLQVGAHSSFHALIAEHSGNGRLVALLPLIRMTSSSLSSALDPAFAEERGSEGFALYMEEARRRHQEVYEALKDRDERKAEETARRHIRATLRSSLVERVADDGSSPRDSTAG